MSAYPTICWSLRSLPKGPLCTPPPPPPTGNFLKKALLLCIFPKLISLQESCGSRFRLISRLFGCLKCLLLLIVHHIPEIRNDHPSIVVKVAKSFCKNTKYCSAIQSAIFLRSVMTTHQGRI